MTEPTPRTVESDGQVTAVDPATDAVEPGATRDDPWATEPLSERPVRDDDQAPSLEDRVVALEDMAKSRGFMR